MGSREQPMTARRFGATGVYLLERFEFSVLESMPAIPIVRSGRGVREQLQVSCQRHLQLVDGHLQHAFGAGWPIDRRDQRTARQHRSGTRSDTGVRTLSVVCNRAAASRAQLQPTLAALALPDPSLTLRTEYS